MSGFDEGIRVLLERLRREVGDDCRRWGSSALDRHEQEFLHSVIPAIAHVNAARCSVNARRNAQAAGELYKNCRCYLADELAVLNPDVVVTQGAPAKDALRASTMPISNWAACQEGCALPKPRAIRDCHGRSHVVRLGGRRTLWIETYHPNQGQGLFSKEGGPSWDCYAAAMRSFVRNDRNPSTTSPAS
jgi:hypothetical protein